MKKLISLVLVLVLVLSLSACGKSEEVKNVEAQISALAGLSMETIHDVDTAREQITAARNAFNALSTKEQEKVENLADLEAAENLVFDTEYAFLINLIKFHNLNCDVVTTGVITVWDNVGASDFYTYYNAIFFFDDKEKTLDDYSAEFGTSLYASLWCAGKALCPEYVSGTKIKDESAVIENCATFNLAYSNVEQATSDIQARVIRLNGSHSGTKMEALYDWWMESALYADLALNPSGSLASYTSSVSTFRSNLDRYALNAEMQ